MIIFFSIFGAIALIVGAVFIVNEVKRFLSYEQGQNLVSSENYSYDQAIECFEFAKRKDYLEQIELVKADKAFSEGNYEKACELQYKSIPENEKKLNKEALEELSNGKGEDEDE